LARQVTLGCRPSTIEQYTRLLKRPREAWGTRSADSITKRDINALMDQVTAKRRRSYAPAPNSPPFAEADNILAVIKGMFRMADGFDWTESDPARNVPKRGQPVPRSRFLTESEIVAAWRGSEEHVEWYPFGAAFQMSLLTGQRMGEGCGLPWSEINRDGVWFLPAERAKNGRAHTIALSKPAMAILERIRRDQRYHETYVFTADARKPVSHWTDAHRRLVKHMDDTIGKRERWVPHDLRRTCATGMAALGVEESIIERVLNHTVSRTSAVAATYNVHNYAAEKADALNQWGAHVEALVHA